MADSKKPQRRKAGKARNVAKTGANDRRMGVRLLGAAAAAIGLGAATLAILAGRRRNPAEHAAPDLAADAPEPGTNRAPDAFRPDPTAPVPPEMRESLRPVTGPAPSLAADRGSTLQ